MRNLLLNVWTGVDAQHIESIQTWKIILASLGCNLVCLGFSVITSKVDFVMTVVGDTLNVFMCFVVPCIY